MKNKHPSTSPTCFLKEPHDCLPNTINAHTMLGIMLIAPKTTPQALDDLDCPII